MTGLLQPDPIIVDVGQRTGVSPDVSIDFVVGMFAMAGVFLLAAAIGSAIVAGCVLLVKRRRHRLSTGSPGPSTDHTTLRIS